MKKICLLTLLGAFSGLLLMNSNANAQTNLIVINNCQEFLHIRQTSGKKVWPGWKVQSWANFATPIKPYCGAGACSFVITYGYPQNNNKTYVQFGPEPRTSQTYQYEIGPDGHCRLKASKINVSG